MMTSGRRKQTLARLIEERKSMGRRVESKGDFKAVLSYGKPTNRLLRWTLLLTVNSVWILVWLVIFVLVNIPFMIIYALFNDEHVPEAFWGFSPVSFREREILKVDEEGKTSVAPLLAKDSRKTRSRAKS